MCCRLVTSNSFELNHISRNTSLISGRRTAPERDFKFCITWDIEESSDLLLEFSLSFSAWLDPDPMNFISKGHHHHWVRRSLVVSVGEAGEMEGVFPIRQLNGAETAIILLTAKE